MIHTGESQLSNHTPSPLPLPLPLSPPPPSPLLLFSSSPLFSSHSLTLMPSLYFFPSSLSYPYNQPTDNTSPNHNPLSTTPLPTPLPTCTDPYDCTHTHLLRIRVECPRAKKLHQLFPLHQPRERRVSVLLLPPFHAAEMVSFSTSRTFFLRRHRRHRRHQRRVAGHLTLTTTTHPTSCFTTVVRSSPSSSPTSARRCDHRR